MLSFTLHGDYWETMQEESGYLTIDTVTKKSYVLSNIHFFVSGSNIRLNVLYQYVEIVEEEEWSPGDLIVFRHFSEEYYYVTNLRTNTTVIAKETFDVVF